MPNSFPLKLTRTCDCRDCILRERIARMTHLALQEYEDIPWSDCFQTPPPQTMQSAPRRDLNVIPFRLQPAPSTPPTSPLGELVHYDLPLPDLPDPFDLLSPSAVADVEDAVAGPASAPARQGGCRHWVFTLNHPGPDEYVHLACLCDELEAGNVRYLVMGREVGEGGTPHLQGYLELWTRKRLAWLKLHVNDRCHYEPRHGTREVARDYCCKDGDWIEFGDFHEEERGRRTDLETMVEQASQGTPFYDAVLAEATTAQFPHAYIKLLEGRALAETPAWRDVVVVVKIGATGCGKTRAALNIWPDVFMQDCSAGGEIWWDGYSGQRRLVLDDFDGHIPFKYLLRLLDGYPIRLKVKGAFTYGTWSEVVITSNSPISVWYRRVSDISPLLRRISVVHQYTGANEYVSNYICSAIV